jgi:sulfoxide reductase heme-binding subunit YedZ
MVERVRRLLFLLCLAPFLKLAAGACTGHLGADPVATLTRSTGIWALNFLFLTLVVSPLRKFTGWNWLMRLRRTLALYSFFYACLHLAVYVAFEHFFDVAEMFDDVVRHPYVAAGMIGFVLLVPLAVTSTDKMMKKLGGRRWLQLHRLVYLCAIAAVLHFLLLVKRDITEPALYIVLLCGLLCVRMVMRPRQRAVPAQGGLRPASYGGGGGAAVPRSRK